MLVERCLRTDEMQKQFDINIDKILNKGFSTKEEFSALLSEIAGAGTSFSSEINDVFTNGIWIKNNREVLIGSFFYDYADPIKNNFNGMMLVTRKNENSKGKNYRLNMKDGKFNLKG